MAKKRRKGRKKHATKSHHRARKSFRHPKSYGKHTIRGFSSNAKKVKAFWRKHRAAIMKHAPKKRFKYVWSQIKKGRR